MAAFVDYDNFVKAVGDWLARDYLSEEIPDWIWITECELQRDLNLRLNDAILTGTAVADQEYLDLPDDFAEGFYLRWESDTLPPVTVSSFDKLDAIQKGRETSGTQNTRTRHGTFHNNRIYLGPVPGALDYTLFYKSGAQHLGPANQTNIILQQYPDALLYGTLMHSAPYLGSDERALVWGQLYARAKASARQQEWRARTGHGPLRMQPDIEVR